MITIGTEESAYFARLVIVIDGQPSSELSSQSKADCTFTVLSVEEFLVLLSGDSIQSFDMPFMALLRDFMGRQVMLTTGQAFTKYIYNR